MARLRLNAILSRVRGRSGESGRSGVGTINCVDMHFMSLIRPTQLLIWSRTGRIIIGTFEALPKREGRTFAGGSDGCMSLIGHG